jgi:cation diffusion facilitator family transporter
MTSKAAEEKSRGDAEKRLVALSSVAAALVLVGGKLTVGLWTNSLGILSEAMHSGLDLVAAAVTFWAVRVSGRPADKDHTYGHGKIENLSALFETMLLLLTCVWIVYEAAHRLLGDKPIEVDASIWAFVVVIVSIVIDYSRSRALKRTAEKYDSQALEADALHFSTDIWSSTVVLVGLVCVRLADMLDMPWLHKADAVAALGVAIIVVWVSIKLGKKSVDDLLDTVPPDLPARMRALAEAAEGVKAVSKVRVRKAGPDIFADITITTEADAGLERAHDVAHRVEASVKASMPKADVVVHVSPAEEGNEELPTMVRRVAHRRGIHAHDIVVRKVGDERVLEVHIELPSELRVDEAHEMASAFEQELLERRPELGRVVTHIEPIARDAATRPVDATQVREVIEEMAEEHCGGGNWRPDAIDVSDDNGTLSVSFHCVMDADETVAAAHETTERLERMLRERLPDIGRVVIHVEPRDG